MQNKQVAIIVVAILAMAQGIAIAFNGCGDPSTAPGLSQK